MGDIRDLRQKN